MEDEVLKSPERKHGIEKPESKKRKKSKDKTKIDREESNETREVKKIKKKKSKSKSQDQDQDVAMSNAGEEFDAELEPTELKKSKKKKRKSKSEDGEDVTASVDEEPEAAELKKSKKKSKSKAMDSEDDLVDVEGEDKTKKKSKKKSKLKAKPKFEILEAQSPKDFTMGENMDDAAAGHGEDLAEREAGGEDEADGQSSPASPAAPSPNANEEETFESLYLRQMTKEFADDIDAVRQAPDFHGQASLDVLVAALKQGVEVYPEEFREEYMRVWRQGGGGGEVRNAM